MSDTLLKITPDDSALLPATTGGKWITVAIASQRAETNASLIRRWILEQGWESRGLARQVKLSSGQSGWEVLDTAHAKFALVKSSEALTNDFRSSREFLALPSTIRDRALQREIVLSDWENRIRAGQTLRMSEAIVTKQFVAEMKSKGIEVSRASLFNWRKEYRSIGLRGLLDQWGKREAPDTSSFWIAGSEPWLHTNKRSAKICYEIALSQAEIHGWETMSYRDFCRKLSQIPQGVVDKRRNGENTFVALSEPSVTRDYYSIDANDWWCSDDHTLDILVRIGTDTKGEPIYKRPYLHAWEDLRSRKIVGWAILPHAPRASDVLRTFVDAAKTYGVPKNVLLDNGKSFDNRTLQGVTKHQRLRGKRPGDLSPAEMIRVGGAFNTLGIIVTHAKKYHGQSKPIERMFGTICSRFSKLFDGYVGPSTTQKPDALKIAIKRGNIYTIDQIREAFGIWLEQDYNGKAGHSGHAMEGKSPDAVYYETRKPARVLSNEILEFATFERTEAKVHKNGVTWKGIQYGYAMDELINRRGETVVLAVDERQVDHVYVIDLNGAWICCAQANQRLPFGPDKRLLTEAQDIKKRARRAADEYNKQRPHLASDTADLAFVAMRNRKALQDKITPPIEQPPVSIRMVQTPFIEEAPKIERALNQKHIRKAESDESSQLTGLRTFSYAANRRANEDDAPGIGFSYRLEQTEKPNE